MIRPIETATVSRTSCLASLALLSRLRLGDTVASRPRSSAIAADPLGVVAVGDEHDLGDRLGDEEPGRGGQRLPRARAVDLLEEGRVGHALVAEVVVARGRLGEAVALLPPAGDHDLRGEAAAVELEGVVEAVLQHRRRRAVVLRGAQHDDGVGRARRRRGGWPGTPGRTCRRRRSRSSTSSTTATRTREAQRASAPPAPAGPPRRGHSRARASRSRASVRSRPERLERLEQRRADRAAGGGHPHRALGLAELRPGPRRSRGRPSTAAASIAARIAVRGPRIERRRARRSWRRASRARPCPSPSPSSTTRRRSRRARRARKATIGSTSVSRRTRSCTSGGQRRQRGLGAARRG